MCLCHVAEHYAFFYRPLFSGPLESEISDVIHDDCSRAVASDQASSFDPTDKNEKRKSRIQSLGYRSACTPMTFWIVRRKPTRENRTIDLLISLMTIDVWRANGTRSTQLLSLTARQYVLLTKHSDCSVLTIQINTKCAAPVVFRMNRQNLFGQANSLWRIQITSETVLYLDIIVVI